MPVQRSPGQQEFQETFRTSFEPAQIEDPGRITKGRNLGEGPDLIIRPALQIRPLC